MIVGIGGNALAGATSLVQEERRILFRRSKMLTAVILVAAAYIVFNVADYRRKNKGSGLIV